MNARKTLMVNGKNHLNIGGADAVELAKQYGTPLYVMDKEYVEDMCSTYKNAIEKEYGNGEIVYASKAFSCKEIYRIVGSLGLGADAVSSGEIYTALQSGFDAGKIYFHGNAKSMSELKYAIENGVGFIVCDSIEEMEIINDIATKTAKVQNVLIRVNAGIEAHTHHYIQTATPDSKFGFLLEDGSALNAIKTALKLPKLKLCGLHSHIGSQIFEKKSFEIAGKKLVDYYNFVKKELDYEFCELNLGGGFGIYYSEDDKMMKLDDYAEFVKCISKVVKESCNEIGYTLPKLVLEPGRSIVGEAGVTLYTVEQIKKIKDRKTYAAIDGGMFENPRFALYNAKYTVVKANEVVSDTNLVYTIAGKCCESGDMIAENVSLPPLTRGDILAVLSTGAYNYSMASNYNRNLVPPVVFVKDGKSYYAVKPQSFEDLVRNDV